MQNRRIIYHLEPFNFPSGGVATIYKHVEILNKHGYQAYVALRHQPTEDFYGSSAPLILHQGNLSIKNGDIWVLPEVSQKLMFILKDYPVRKVMFCQNHYYMPFSDDSSLGIHEYPVDNIIVSSEAIRSFMKKVYDFNNAQLIPYYIDKSLFFEPEYKIRQIAYMPRKLPKLARFIEATFKRVYKQYADIPWVPIDGVNQEVAADIMRRSQIFFSLSNMESFGLPPLEAMACGCLVVGLHGEGGKEYMTKQNGWWFDLHDWNKIISGLDKAISMLDENGDALRLIQNQMRLTVNNYSISKMENELLKFWDLEIKTPF